MKKGIDFSQLPTDVSTTKKIIDKTSEENILERQLGLIGKLIGSGDNVKMNIATLTIIVLLGFAIIYTIIICIYGENTKAISIEKIWSIVLPVVTLALGYAFGKKDNN